VKEMDFIGNFISMLFGNWIFVFLLSVFLLILLAFGSIKFVYSLARKNKFFTFIEEGTCKAVVRAGEFRRFFISWQDKTFKIFRDGPQSQKRDNWRVVEGSSRSRFFGGLRFFLWPLDQIFSHEFKWTHLHEDGSVASHEKQVDYMLLKKEIYIIDYPITDQEAIEDIEGVPLAIRVSLPVRVVNPYVAMFVVRRWLANINVIIKGTVRSFVAQYRFKEDLLDMVAGKGIENIQKKKGIIKENLSHPGDDLKQKLQQTLGKAFLKENKEEKEEAVEREEGNIEIYGVLILKQGLDIIKIDPDSKHRELTFLKYKADREKEKAQVDAEAKAIAFSLESSRTHKLIVERLIEQGLSKEDANEKAFEYAKYWKGSEEKIIHDWRFNSSGGSLKLEEFVAKLVAITQEAKKE
jgi:hypothetical protein